MDYIMHYGLKRKSGRYPWGSGDTPYQHESWFKWGSDIDAMYKDGMTEKELADTLGWTVKQLRARNTISIAEGRSAAIRRAQQLKDKGYSNTAIGEAMGVPEATVRNYLKPGAEKKARAVFETSDALKKNVDEFRYIDIGAGSCNHMGVSSTKLEAAVEMLKEQGYKTENIYVKQGGTNYKTTMKVLCPIDVTKKELYDNLDKITYPNAKSGDGGSHFEVHVPPANISSTRVTIAYESPKDGTIEIRRGVEDLTLGQSRYAQVRIGVDGTHYLKGVAVYTDDLPPGVDIRFNTNKKAGTPMMSADGGVLKKQKKEDELNPFGASFTQRRYIGSDGKEHLSAINIVNEEGAWSKWDKNLASQMLSKQSPQLAKRQLNLDIAQKEEEFAQIKSLTNPTLKKQLLEEFANNCDTAAVHLKAAAMPRQATKLLISMPSLKPGEVYAPHLNNGERVVLIRYPHGGKFEIPELIVNNHNKEGKRILGDTPIDAIGIHPDTAKTLSGADFDGDTVLCIPNNKGEIKRSSPIASLQDFDPSVFYVPGFGKTIKERTKQQKMGEVSNLITDMTIQAADRDEIARAVKHSMVVIDAIKHDYDYKASYREFGIAELAKKYQGKAGGGASTIISRAKGQARVNERSEYVKYDPETGEKIYKETGRTKLVKDKVTGEWYDSGDKVQVKSTKMAEARDARELMSSNPKDIEIIYANYANKMKAMGNSARKEYMATPTLKYNPSAKAAYAAEVASLDDKVKRAEMNAPKERQAQRLKSIIYKSVLEDNPDLDDEHKKKEEGRALERAREMVGAKKEKVTISPREWQAIQAGAITENKLKKILNNADSKEVKKLAMPRDSRKLSNSTIARIKNMANLGYSQGEIAETLGISSSTVSEYINA